MTDVKDVAVAAWRLEKWLDNIKVERKMAAKSSLRAIKRYLDENHIEVIDLTGTKFDVGLAVSVVNNESDETDEEKLIISEMVKPIIKENGAVIQYGQVILGDKVKKIKENNVVEISSVDKDDKEKGDCIANKTKEKQFQNDIEENKVNCLSDDKKKLNSKLGIVIMILQILMIILILIIFIRFNNILTLGDNPNNENKIVESTLENGKNENIPSDSEKNLKVLKDQIDSIEKDVSILLKGESLKGESSILEKMENNDYFIYVVKPGDTLIQICQENNIDYYANKALILRINYMENGNIIESGQKLLLPKNN